VFGVGGCAGCSKHNKRFFGKAFRLVGIFIGIMVSENNTIFRARIYQVVVESG
jgi:hypothetical protein